MLVILLVAAALVSAQVYAIAYLAYLWVPALAAVFWRLRISLTQCPAPTCERVADGPSGEKTERSFVILISAHNEERVIGALLDSLARQHYPPAKRSVYVVANNCTDRTAAVVRGSEAATCLERTGGDVATKGAALGWLWERVSHKVSSCDCVVILDADNLVPPDFLRELNLAFDEGYQVVQSARCAKNAGDSWASQLDAISEALWNRLDQAGRMRLGLSATIAGSGTAFTRPVFDWLSGCKVHTLCEDIEWQARLMLAGIRVGYAERARLFDEKTSSPAQLGRQRERWVAGVALAACHYGPLLLGSGVWHKDIHRIVAGFGATKPPRSVLCALLGLLALLGIVRPESVALLPWPFWLGGLGSLGGYVLVGMAVDNARPRAYLALICAPLFLLMMVATFATGVLRASTLQWIPTVHERSVSIDEMEPGHRGADGSRTRARAK